MTTLLCFTSRARPGRLPTEEERVFDPLLLLQWLLVNSDLLLPLLWIIALAPIQPGYPTSLLTMDYFNMKRFLAVYSSHLAACGLMTVLWTFLTTVIVVPQCLSHSQCYYHSSMMWKESNSASFKHPKAGLLVLCLTHLNHSCLPEYSKVSLC